MKIWLLCAVLLSSISTSATQSLLQIDGYHGIWFELGQKSEYGDKYSGGLGTYTTSHAPIAMYSAESQKTFFVYGGTIPGKRHLLIMASYFDHATGTVPQPAIVHDKGGVNDPHDNASMSMDSKGHIWVFVSGRGNARPGFIYRSSKPFDVQSFELVHTRDRMAYPQPWYHEGDGFCFLFTMYTKGREAYWMTSPDGITWNNAKKLAGFGGHYQTSAQRGRSIVTAFNYHPGGSVDKRTNLYLLRSDDFGKSWKNAAGDLVQTPLEDTYNSAIVYNYEKEGRMVYIQDVSFDTDGHPVILYVLSNGHKPGPQNPARSWHTARWLEVDKTWDINTVTTSTHNYDVGALYCESDTWRIIGPSEAGPQTWGTGGEMVMWSSSNKGKSWIKEKQLTVDSLLNHSYARKPVNAHEDFYALWADGHADKLSPSHLYFSTKQGKVYRLPRSMGQQHVKPQEF